ncbi:MAG: MBL fold metallo-hydrolase [Candidatus Peregrinibacteria bacterium]
MKLISHGAAREVTGTCHELQIETASGTKRILLDCGLFQGKRSEAAAKNAAFPFDPARDIDAVILTHAHMDHAGRIPLLYKRGCRSSVHCTFATKDLSEVMLLDAGYIQEKDEAYFSKHLHSSRLPEEGPLYTQEDATACMEIFHAHNYGDWFPVCDGVRAQLLEAGHIVGAAMIVLEVQEKGGAVRTIGFSGDLGRGMLPIIRDPAPMPPVSILLCETTYGNREHEDITTARGHLRDAIVRTAKRGGKVLIPAFSLERTQEIVYDLHILWDEKGIPAIPIFIDSPLASRVTDVFMKHPECYDRDIYDRFLARAHNPFQFSLVKYTVSTEESKALNGMPGPMIIMAGSGMCEAGRIRHHLRNNLEDARNSIVAVGYMAENTLGRKLLDPAVTEVKLFDEIRAKKAEIVSINAYSGHAGMHDLHAFVEKTEQLKTLVLVHGEIGQMEPFAAEVKRIAPAMQIIRPERDQVVEL